MVLSRAQRLHRSPSISLVRNEINALSRGNAMDMKFNVKYKFKVNGKEYSSLNEMPASIREAYEKQSPTLKE
jgi:hypothetical protein